VAVDWPAAPDHGGVTAAQDVETQSQHPQHHHRQQHLQLQEQPLILIFIIGTGKATEISRATQLAEFIGMAFECFSEASCRVKLDLMDNFMSVYEKGYIDNFW